VEPQEPHPFEAERVVRGTTSVSLETTPWDTSTRGRARSPDGSDDPVRHPESIDPLEIRVYEGQDATFTLYEDEGDTYDYESGKYSTIKFSWSESAKQLTIGSPEGSYPGMPTTRTFNVVFVGANHGAGLAVTATPDKIVRYNGAAMVVTAN
jgi:hypothetical protein